MHLIERVRTSVHELLASIPAAPVALDPNRTIIAAAAVRAIEKGLPQPLDGIVASADANLGAALATSLAVPLRKRRVLADRVRGSLDVPEGASVIEVLAVEPDGETARVRLCVHTATSQRSASLVSSEMALTLERRNRKRWRLVSRRIRIVV